MKMNTRQIKWMLAIVLVLVLVTGVWAAQTIGTTPIAGRVKTLAVTGAATVGAKLTALTMSVGQTSTLVGTTTFGNGYTGTGATMTGTGALSTKGAIVGASTLAVTGASTLTGAVSCGNTLTTTGAISGASNLAIVGTSTLAGQAYLGRTIKKVPIVGRTVTDFDAQAATLTIAGLLGGVATQNSKTGASTATTPTGAEISAGIAGVATGDSFTVLFYNRGNQTSTITAGASGVTVYGTAAVPTTKTAWLMFICTGANTWSCYVVLSA